MDNLVDQELTKETKKETFMFVLTAIPKDLWKKSTGTTVIGSIVVIVVL